MTDENHDRLVGFLNGDRVALAIIVGNARRQLFVGMLASSERDGKTDKRSRDEEGSLAVDGNFGCHCLCPRPASVGNKAIGAAIIPDRLDAARNAIDAINAAQEIGLRVRPTRKTILPPPTDPS